MRTITWIRNYCLLVFFVVLAGGVILRPGRCPATPPTSPTSTTHSAAADDITVGGMSARTPA